jgi:NifB/MoaA-like Fe-S oxidoreductase
MKIRRQRMEANGFLRPDAASSISDISNCDSCQRYRFLCREQMFTKSLTAKPFDDTVS